MHRNISIGPTPWTGLVLAVVMLAWSGPTAGQSLRGRVVDVRTDVPVADARVVLADREGSPVMEAVSDDNGLFILYDIPAGEYRVAVEAFRYSATAERTVRTDELPLFVEIQVRPAPLETEGIAVRVRPRESYWRNKVQIITGKVLDARTDDPIEAMDVIVRNLAGESVGRTLSDEEGRFGLRVDQPGLYRVAVSRFGYDSTATANLAVSPEQNLYVEVRVQPAAFGLDPITVTAPRMLPYLESTGFYERQKRGLGSFLGPKDLARIPGAFPTQYLRRVAGLSVTRGQIRIRGVTMGSCSPKIVLDYMEVRGVRLDDIVRANEIEAIEVYKGPATVPPQWRDAATCGVIAVWTKH